MAEHSDPFWEGGVNREAQHFRFNGSAVIFQLEKSLWLYWFPYSLLRSGCFKPQKRGSKLFSSFFSVNARLQYLLV